jgi:hypothetical protein
MTMKRTLTATMIALTLPMAALAADFDTLDGDSDAFLSADTNADGALSPEEVSAAQSEGILPPNEG